MGDHRIERTEQEKGSSCLRLPHRKHELPYVLEVFRAGRPDTPKPKFNYDPDDSSFIKRLLHPDVLQFPGILECFDLYLVLFVQFYECRRE